VIGQILATVNQYDIIQALLGSSNTQQWFLPRPFKDR